MANVPRTRTRRQLPFRQRLKIFLRAAMLRQPERTGFFLHIDTDNAAFHSQDPDAEDFDLYRDIEDRSRELARILQRLVRDVESGVERGSLLDVNGNIVGEFRTIDS